MEPIDVIAAMEEELIRLRKVRAVIPWFDERIRLHHSGVGKVNGALAATQAVQAGARSIIIVGTAGALAPGLHIGDIVIVNRAVQHDVDVGALGFPRGTIPFEEKSEWRADEALVRIVEHAAREPGSRVTVGSICSGERFIADDVEKQWLHEHFGGVCTDMETGAIAQACARLGIPWVGIRIISDGANRTAAADFAAILAFAADDIARIITRIVGLDPPPGR